MASSQSTSLSIATSSPLLPLPPPPVAVLALPPPPMLDPVLVPSLTEIPAAGGNERRIAVSMPTTAANTAVRGKGGAGAREERRRDGCHPRHGR